MISQMSGIERATVVIDQPESSGLGRSHVASSASVTVLTRGTELNQNQVDAIAQLVARSHAGLKADNVAVSDARAGRILFCRSNDAMSANKYLDVKTAAEQHAARTLETALNYIPGVRIAVNAQVDTTTVVQRKSTVDDPKVGPTSESTQTMTSASAAPAAEPAVRPNTGASLASATRGGTSSSTEKSESTTVPVFGQTESQIQDGRGYPLQINASVGIPRSYFVRIAQQEAGGDENAAPDAATVDQLIAAETDRIKAYVTPLIDTQAIDGAKAGTVTVSVFQDFGVAATLVSNSIEGSVAGGGGGGFVGGTVSEGLVKYASLGSLAVIALAMMFMMVRKATVRQEMPTAQELVGIPPALTAAESDLVGEADEASPALEGLEINEESLRRQQMLDQITEMVATTPDEAAGLLRRWIRSEH
jgi:flagellar biosynthesis/type III secretory pathway M-ring protein FliF/YscJ